MGSGQSNLAKIEASLDCKLSKCDLDQSATEFPNPNSATIESPLCRVIRAGRYRAMASLLVRGAKVSSSMVSMRDGLDLL